MPRTTNLENYQQDQSTEQTPRRRQVPPEYERETRCYWPCPCGGTVPDAPDHCVWRKRRGKANTYCTDASICASQCPDKGVCDAYKDFKKRIKERKRHDELEFMQRHQKEDVPNDLPTMRGTEDRREETPVRKMLRGTSTGIESSIQTEDIATEPGEKTIRRRIVNEEPETEVCPRKIRRGC